MTAEYWKPEVSNGMFQLAALLWVLPKGSADPRGPYDLCRTTIDSTSIDIDCTRGSSTRCCSNKCCDEVELSSSFALNTCWRGYWTNQETCSHTKTRYCCPIQASSTPFPVPSTCCKSNSYEYRPTTSRGKQAPVYLTCKNSYGSDICTRRYSTYCCYGTCCDKYQFGQFTFKTCSHPGGWYKDYCRDHDATYCCQIEQWKRKCCNLASYEHMKLTTPSFQYRTCTRLSDGTNVLRQNTCTKYDSTYCCYESCCPRIFYYSSFDFKTCRDNSRIHECRDYRSTQCCPVVSDGLTVSVACCFSTSMTWVPIIAISESTTGNGNSKNYGDKSINDALYSGIAAASVMGVGFIVLLVMVFGFRSSTLCWRSNRRQGLGIRQSSHPDSATPYESPSLVTNSSYGPFYTGPEPEPTNSFSAGPPAYDPRMTHRLSASQTDSTSNSTPRPDAPSSVSQTPVEAPYGMSPQSSPARMPISSDSLGVPPYGSSSLSSPTRGPIFGTPRPSEDLPPPSYSVLASRPTTNDQPPPSYNTALGMEQAKRMTDLRHSGAGPPLNDAS